MPRTSSNGQPLELLGRGRYLFALTHPDDEISMCALIRAVSRSGTETYLSWTHHTDVRRAEAEAFADRVAVPRANLFFHGAPDGSVCDEIPSLFPRFDRMLLAAKPDVVFCGAFEQGHLDHDSTNFLLRRTFGGPVIEAPFYHSYLTRLQRIGNFAGEGGASAERLLTPDEREFKKIVAKGYPSQNIYSLAIFHEARELLSGRRPRLLRRELFREATHPDFLVPNHRPEMRAKIERCAPWQRWLTAMKRV